MIRVASYDKTLGYIRQRLDSGSYYREHGNITYNPHTLVRYINLDAFKGLDVQALLSENNELLVHPYTQYNNKWFCFLFHEHVVESTCVSALNKMVKSFNTPDGIKVPKSNFRTNEKYVLVNNRVYSYVIGDIFNNTPLTIYNEKVITNSPIKVFTPNRKMRKQYRELSQKYVKKALLEQELLKEYPGELFEENISSPEEYETLLQDSALARLVNARALDTNINTSYFNKIANYHTRHLVARRAVYVKEHLLNYSDITEYEYLEYVK
jgi:hypothetical protein